jgi:hypothetical protein
MGQERCPNCGQRMEILREDHQQAGVREVRLRWLICSHCRHVALKEWSFLDDTASPASHVPQVPDPAGCDGAGGKCE